MKTWLLNSWDSLRTNFWFVPSLMVAGSVLLSFLTLWLDHRAGTGPIASAALAYSRGPEGARAILSAVAGSMVTIASLTFSITIVTLQLASSQFGPRLLRGFVRDRGNQVVLGTFIATFTYCLLILRAVNGTEEHEFVPQLSVITAMLLTLASLGVLIYFIHHTSHSIQAETVVDSVGRDLREAIDRLFPERLGEDAAAAERPPSAATLPAGFDAGSRPVPATESDYLQNVDGERLLGLATERDMVLRVEHRPGRFVVAGQDLVRVWPASRLDDQLAEDIRGAFYFGSRRTLTQDAEFAVDQLVEVAVRALSPGINDPFTAISCLDRLGAALAHLGVRSTPSAYRFDERGQLRVVVDATTMAGLVDAAFHQIRQAARSNAAVTLRLLETIAVILPFARDTTLRESLLRHAELVHEGSQEGIPSASDRREAAERYQAILTSP
jgi:uncharacterized membrane protein